MEKKIVFSLAIALASLSGLPVQGQKKVVPLKYGNMDHWVIRNIKESAIIGGNQKTIYAVGPNIKVLAAGSLFLGDVREPITSTKDGPKAINWGIPFTARPKAVQFDYKTYMPQSANRIKQNGFSGASTVAGRDYAIAVLYLQKRHEDARGNITAKRVGTMVVKYGKSTNGWVNDATYTIHYGDIRHMAGYDAATMGLRSTDYARNSKGKSVPVRETGWAGIHETPTHLILQFSSSHGGAYIGTPGNTLWIDNVALVYE